MDFLTRDEVHRALSALTKAERAKINAAARRQAAKTSVEAGDLMNAAFERALSGERKWPRGVDAVHFFAGDLGVIRSLANASRRQTAIRGEQELTETNEPKIEYGTPPALTLRDILAQFANEPVAQLIIMGRIAGEEGESMRAKLGIDKTAYAKILKQIWRRINIARKDGKL